ncbi:type IV secretion system protein VirB3 [Fulvimarina endophytica]|uniref:Type IV secretion system protein VirB3 n=1 Tax=Fulvimarina endophytica TaxID=2293836 RepID=A0A371WYN5_9HYPH|nr:VirB3 family type IV secretion system protein [Fulvimarina endophytica]RFC61874.1 type IV secretion system protein VirB3 [Fulvimarina endophytica]
MAEQSPVYLGLVRPAKLLGLPMMYAMVWLFASVLLFLWIQSWIVLALSALAYPAIWKAADWDPHFLNVVAVSLEETRPTPNRARHGGDSYAP